MTTNNSSTTVLPWIAAITGGMLVFLGYAGFDRFYLEWICLVPVLWAIRDQRPGRAFRIGWLAGIVMNIGGFYWAIQMFREFAGMPWPLAALGMLLLATANGFLFAAWAWATRLITRDTGWSVAWVSPVVWTALEKFWPEIFPNYLGASQYRLPLVTQVADLTGILGVTFIVVYFNSTLFAALEQWFGNRRGAIRQLLVLALVMAAVLIYGQLRIGSMDRQAATAEHLTIGLVQTNRGAGDKRHDPESLLREHQEMSRTLVARQPLDLIVWPETATGSYLRYTETPLPTSASSFGRATTEWSDGEWWEFVAYYQKTGPTSARQYYWRRRLTTGGQIVDNAWVFYAYEMTGSPTPQVSSIELGINKNKNNPTDMYITWGPWDVVDGSRYPNPFGVPNVLP